MSVLKSVLDLAARAVAAATDLGRLAELLRDRGFAVALAAGLLGLAALTVAARFPRGLAAAGGAVLAALAAYALRGAIAAHLGISLAVATPVLAVVAGAACALVPLAFPAAVGALPGLLLGLHAPIAGRAELGAAIGALVAGLVGLLFARLVAVGFASAVGGLLVGAAAVALGGARPLARELVTHPLAIVALALVLAVAGAAYQLAHGVAPARAPRPPPAA
ncbi:hypothetical protein [Anaeromyxobacter sp. SG66]|uniref:hypothetical protein n=1 Tax=Anaeromyxobacter sp. SG66 TaxID=2925410 RepID=UPI001F5A30E2|nr:hypothetical protein [Anaeromyxobacter sp. SG66]